MNTMSDKDKKGDGKEPKKDAGDKTPNNDKDPEGGKDSTLEKTLKAQKEHYRDKASKAEAELEKMKQEKEEAEKKNLEENEKYKELYEKEKEKGDRLSSQAQENAKKFAFLKVAAKHKIRTPEDAFKLLDQDKIKVSDDGSVDETGLDDLVKGFAEERPHFVESDPKTTPKGGGSTPPAGGGSDNHGDQTTFKRSQLQDHAFYMENKDEILKAEKEGRITDE